MGETLKSQQKIWQQAGHCDKKYLPIQLNYKR